MVYICKDGILSVYFNIYSSRMSLTSFPILLYDVFSLFTKTKNFGLRNTTTTNHLTNDKHFYVEKLFSDCSSYLFVRHRWLSDKQRNVSKSLPDFHEHRDSTEELWWQQFTQTSWRSSPQDCGYWCSKCRWWSYLSTWYLLLTTFVFQLCVQFTFIESFVNITLCTFCL